MADFISNVRKVNGVQISIKNITELNELNLSPNTLSVQGEARFPQGQEFTLVGLTIVDGTNPQGRAFESLCLDFGNELTYPIKALNRSRLNYATGVAVPVAPRGTLVGKSVEQILSFVGKKFTVERTPIVTKTSYGKEVPADMLSFIEKA